MSAVFPCRRALLDEGADAFFGVAGLYGSSLESFGESTGRLELTA